MATPNANPHAQLISDAEQRATEQAVGPGLPAIALAYGDYPAIPLAHCETRRSDLGGLEALCTICWRGFYFGLRAVVHDKAHESWHAEHMERHAKALAAAGAR